MGRTAALIKVRTLAIDDVTDNIGQTDAMQTTSTKPKRANPPESVR